MISKKTQSRLKFENAVMITEFLVDIKDGLVNDSQN